MGSVIFRVPRDTDPHCSSSVCHHGCSDDIHLCREFSLTDREKDVLYTLLCSEESAQKIAEELGISRAALYRHIASLNEKTGTGSRIGLMQFFFSWEKDRYIM
ncbi:MAG: helix-turn-helix transcriptional regulator [Clostridia bacterium]